MMQASFTGKLAMIAQQKRLDTTANNISNVSTTGFKARSVSFKDMLYTNMVNPADPGNAQGNNLQRGTGVLVSAMTLNFAPGAALNTGEALDVFIQGDGFFTVQGTHGETLYSRDGSFALSNEANGRYLVNSEGQYILDENGGRIAVPEGAINDLRISAQGELSMGIGEPPFAKITLVTFTNIYGLSSVGNNSYAQTANSGAPMAATGALEQRFLEASNVDIATEMTNLIRTSRAYSFASRAVTTADEMAGIANNLRT